MRREKQPKPKPNLYEISIGMLPLVRKRKPTAVGPTPRKDENETSGDDINNALQPLGLQSSRSRNLAIYDTRSNQDSEEKWMLQDSRSTLVVPGGFSSSFVWRAIPGLLLKAFPKNFPQVWPNFSEKQNCCFLEMAALLW